MATLENVEQIQLGMRGAVIQPGDPNYDSARAIYNAMIDRRPALIAQCLDVADVISAVNYGREQKMDIAIRSGGHHGAGMCLVDNGLVIDLSRMKGIRVDPRARTVRAQGGCTQGDVDHATHPFGLATPTGIVSTTGIGGLTLGGGPGTSPAPMAWPSITCSKRMWSWPTAASSLPMRRKTPIFSGHCAAAAATLGW